MRLDAEHSLAALLERLAEPSPAPGGGSAAAWCAALAAALLEMTAALSHADEVATRASSLRARLLEAGEAELRAYAPVLLASSPGPRDQALSDASEPPLAIARAATEVAELGVTVAGRSGSAVRGDAVAGVLLAEAATRAAAQLVEINLSDRSDDLRRAEVADLSARAARARAEAMAR